LQGLYTAVDVSRNLKGISVSIAGGWLWTKEPSSVSWLRKINGYSVCCLESRKIDQVIALIRGGPESAINILEIAVKRSCFALGADDAKTKTGKEPARGERVIERPVVGDAPDRVWRPDERSAGLI
jgi:hypothetical protein